MGGRQLASRPTLLSEGQRFFVAGKQYVWTINSQGKLQARLYERSLDAKIEKLGQKLSQAVEGRLPRSQAEVDLFAGRPE